LESTWMDFVFMKGRLKVSRNLGSLISDWATVCDDGFTNNAAKVACHQLKYYTEDAYLFNYAGGGNILLDDVSCNGNEPKFYGFCSHSSIGSHNCAHSKDMGVDCRTKAPTPPPTSYPTPLPAPLPTAQPRGRLRSDDTTSAVLPAPHSGTVPRRTTIATVATFHPVRFMIDSYF